MINRNPAAAILTAGAIMLQVVVLRLPDTLAPLAASLGVILALTTGKYGALKLLRTLRPLLLILLAVLLSRLVADPSGETLFRWLAYTSRLIAAVTVALSLLRRIGPTGLLRGIALLVRPLPLSVRRPIVDILTAAIYLIPAAQRVMAGSSAAARIRLSGDSTHPLKRIIAVARASVISLASLPPRRAEAMVVRGLI
ncbi:MAG: hypothetical protein EA427_05750 [Spirochaetaceae bacterium]|nr:MAG: hypothetical protein EA427_05750 [Spirochaetaceae bacterium]